MTGSGSSITSTGNIANLETDPGNGNTISIAASTPINITGNLAITSGIIADNGNTISIGGNLSGVGTVSGTGKVLLIP